jgi:hypothetical protein
VTHGGTRATAASRLRLVLAGGLARYPQGGGHWACFLQYVRGLADLGHDLFWLDVLPSSGARAQDEALIRIFFRRFRAWGLGDRCAILLVDRDDEQDLQAERIYGVSPSRLVELFRSADLLWNFACGLRQPLLSLFDRRVLVDLDPGHLQVSALSWDMGVNDHDVFLTVGTKLGDADCEVPRLGVTWQPFVPFVYLPMWPLSSAPPEAPFTSVTEWTWEELWMGDRVLSVSKRAAYLVYRGLPQKARRPFELAVNIDPEDPTSDREVLRAHGWSVVNPHQLAGSVGSYARYIRHSRAEFGCPKPIHRALRTGWFSDRSACYLASGRPVLMEDTGFGDHLPAGQGLLVFRDVDEAVASVAEIDGNYERHRRAARHLAEEFLDSRACLRSMLVACGW